MQRRETRTTGDAVSAIGVDVGGTKIAGGIVHFPPGKVIRRRILPTRPERGGEAVLADVMDLARELISQIQGPPTNFAGIGVAVAELVNAEGAVTSGQTISWAGMPVRERLWTIAPAVVESDVRAAALAEARFGTGRNHRLVCYVTVGTGISYTLVQDGRPYAGARGNALILSSAPLTVNCPHCHAEASQVLEEYASGPALVRRYNERSRQKAARSEEVLTAAESGEAWAFEVIESAGKALGNSVGFMINILDPEIVIVGGGLGLARGLYWKSFVQSARSHVWSDVTRQVPIRPAALGPDAGVVGAAAVAWETLRHGAVAGARTTMMKQEELSNAEGDSGSDKTSSWRRRVSGGAGTKRVR
jgi:glucokinase